MRQRTWGFGWGAGTGVMLALVALLIVDPGSHTAGSSHETLGSWLTVNLGHSTWLFAIVFTLYAFNMRQLNSLLGAEDRTQNRLTEVVKLDQLSDVWIHLFVGIGVIWTAVGMRSALQSALGDPGSALTDTADNVLRKLVDGGILLALTTTIVGGVGGYLMRLAKTVLVGAPLQDFYEDSNRRELRELVTTAERIEARLDGIGKNAYAGVTPIQAAQHDP